MRLIIIGSGLAGSLAAEYFRSFKPEVYDARPDGLSFLSNHSAVLRLKTREAGDITGRGVTEIKIKKEIYHEGKHHSSSNIMLDNLYSRKVSNNIEARSITKVSPCVETRFLLNDFEPRYTGKTELKGVDLNKKALRFIQHNAEELSFDKDYDFVISTIPLPVMIRITGAYSKEEFRNFPIFVTKVKYDIPTIGVHQTIYFPGDETPAYRATLEYGTLTVESVNQPANDLEIFEKAFGLTGIKPVNSAGGSQTLGKIVDIDEVERKRLLNYFTTKHKIFSLGRYAIWKNIKTDDLIKDLRRIDEMMKVDLSVIQYDARRMK